MSSRWPAPDAEVLQYLTGETSRTLRTYEIQPALLEEHVAVEAEILGGGYGHRQLHELIQNAADAIVESGRPGRVQVVLTHQNLYCANEGDPIDQNGVKALLHSHLSSKRGGQIGHFGVGFKSVLAITDTPQFFSRSVSFGFDRSWALAQVRQQITNAPEAAVLRLARPLDPETEASQDSVLAELMRWATSVIRLPRTAGRSDWLGDDLETFPAEFLLFASHVSELLLRDVARGHERRLTATTNEHQTTISEGDEAASWRVFDREIGVADLSTEAREDHARTLRGRDTIPLLWAVPIGSKRPREIGQFWAFFPTETQTTLRGILNAPWKTNNDRQNLLEGPFNEALLNQVVDMVATHLSDLLDADDPGRLLDYLPAQDAKNWADRSLAPIITRLQKVEIVPDRDGALQEPVSVLRRPDEVLREAVREKLDVQEGSRWVHRTVETRDRRSRAERLGVPQGTLVQWLESIVRPAPASSVRALSATAILRSVLSPIELKTALKAKVVITLTGERLAIDDSRLVIADAGQEIPANLKAVHDDIVADASARATLIALGVRQLGTLVRVEAELPAASTWDQRWSLLRQITTDQAEALLDKLDLTLNARARNGSFYPVWDVLLPGKVVGSAPVSDASVTIDVTFHENDLELLTRRGAVEEPRSEYDESGASWKEAYELEAIGAFYSALRPGKSRPNRGKLGTSASMAWGPLSVMARLPLDAAATYTSLLLPAAAAEPRSFVSHLTRPTAYEIVPVPSPVVWRLAQFGALRTSLGLRKLAGAVSPLLARWRTFLPVAEIDELVAAPLKLVSTLGELREVFWVAAFEVAARTSTDEVFAFYAAAASFRQAPGNIRVRTGEGYSNAPPAETFAAFDAEQGRALAASIKPFAIVESPEEAMTLHQRWGLRLPGSTVRYVPIGDPVPVADLFPGLRPFLAEARWNMPVQSCQELTLEIEGGSGRVQTVFARQGEGLFFLTSLERSQLLARVTTELGITLGADAVSKVLDFERANERLELQRRVRETPDLASKLTLLLGNDRLTRRLPAAAVVQLQNDPRAKAADFLGNLALAVHGVEVLAIHSDDLRDAGLEPPARWQASPQALEFVDDLGFPPEYAGFQRISRDPTVDVDGPITLPDLHTFQKTISDRVRVFLRDRSEMRGMVSLPTGAGKTRTVVEALVGGLRDGDISGVLVWIAQSDELCEQAVQAWKDIWRVFGPNAPMRISRLWGNTNNRVVSVENQAHVVVSTYQTLRDRVAQARYEWLRDACCVVIDEAHGALAPSYTEILEGFGITARGAARQLIGITATPFRGSRSEEETQRLVNRFGSFRFDHDVIPGNDPYPVLQRDGILAEVDHDVLEGATIELTPAELQALEQYKELPSAVLERIGADQNRNRRLVEAICGQPQNWPVLVFCSSVDQAKLLAALLAFEGVSAKAISGSTDTGARRFYIDEFKRGRLRVLTNYGVLTAGFDAPAIRALYVARPVYSPVTYQQMIGRGLRGPKNGGKPRCLVVNVADNVAQFGERLAFYDFEHLWSREGTS